MVENDEDINKEMEKLMQAQAQEIKEEFPDAKREEIPVEKKKEEMINQNNQEEHNIMIVA